MERPGIMIYFDMMGPMAKLENADKGRLFWAMLEYGKNGIVPVFDSLPLELAWEFVKPKIDKDYREYVRSVQRRQFATACRERKKRGEPEITFDEWLKSMGVCDDQSTSMMTNDNQWYPTTSTTTTPSTSTITSTSTAAATSTITTEPEEGGDGDGSDSVVKVLNGELGKGVVFLSDAQISDLLEKMGLETFDYYVNRLSTFIIKNNANVGKHYDTILDWWNKDGFVCKQKKGNVPRGASGELGAAELGNIQRLMVEK